MFFFLVLSSLLLVSEVSGALAHVARGCAVEGLLDAGADPNFSTLVFTPFMHAASKGHTKLMQVRWSVSVCVGAWQQPFTGVKKPTIESKETYYSVKRDCR